MKNVIFDDGTQATIHEEKDRACTHEGGHDFNPDHGAPFGANGACCLHCGFYVGVEPLN